MKFTLYTADCIGSLSNSIYPNKAHCNRRNLYESGGRI